MKGSVKHLCLQDKAMLLKTSPLKNKAFYRFLFCCFFLLSFQTGEYRLINTIPFTQAKFTTDRLGNAYVIVENQLLVFDTAGKPKANYSNLKSGMLYSVDAANPLKILLF